jgi:uncharacterized OsmC-like protein
MATRIGVHTGGGGVEPAPRDVLGLKVSEDGAVEATNGQGSHVRIGPPGTPDAFTPVELLLAALGGCGAIDVGTLAAKQRRPLEPFSVTVSGWRAEREDRLTRARVVYEIPATRTMREPCSGRSRSQRRSTAPSL